MIKTLSKISAGVRKTQAATVSLSNQDLVLVYFFCIYKLTLLAVMTLRPDSTLSLVSPGISDRLGKLLVHNYLYLESLLKHRYFSANSNQSQMQFQRRIN